MTTQQVATFADVLAAVLHPRERIPVCHATNDSGTFAARVVGWENAQRCVDSWDYLVEHKWFGINPTSLPDGAPKKGTAAEVARLAALHADLDVKDGGCADFDVAQAIIDDLSARVGSAPAWIIMSGHGLQPIWPVDCDDVEVGRRVLRRWGRFVKQVAKQHGAGVDGVYNLDRILRVPNTLNIKSEPHVETFAIPGGSQWL